MKKSFTAVLLGIALAGVALAQNSSEEKSGRVRIAVVEFSPGENASGMTYEAKRHLQASLAFTLFDSKQFDVVDVRRTRAASQDNLAEINGDACRAEALIATKAVASQAA